MTTGSMWSYEPPLRDMQFVIHELLDVRRDWADIPQFSEFDANTTPEILEQAGRFASEILQPTNSNGDAEGCHFEDGRVTTPQGFVNAYRTYRDAGWPALACDPHFGGQGLPQVLNAALYEMLNAANHAWTMYPSLAHGAYECLRAHAPEHLNALYLPKIVSGEWLSTMCLTEPQAGSDLGLIRTRAQPLADGSYSVEGTKIFTSGGEHDLTDNILHLVLARLPSAPAGTRGISLFLVPKRIPDGSEMRPNAVRCDGIEKKMGIRGSATCVMRFAGATGWLIGEPHRGLAAMFVMMNAARIYVGLQGLGHAEAAYQNATRYALERVQMRAAVKPADNSRQAGAQADPIAQHSAIRRTLSTQRALVEGERALAYWSAHLLDLAEHHPSAERRATASSLAALLTPVVKSFLTENGFVQSSAALQVWGGYGYSHEFCIEQTVRDSRIALIYEGTNEIQAIDLLVRKVIGGGNNHAQLLELFREEAQQCLRSPMCDQFGRKLVELERQLSEATAAIVRESAGDPELPYRIAADYLRLVGLCLLGFLWARAARIAAPLVATDKFYEEKFSTARFYFDYVLPEAGFRLILLERGRCPIPWISSGNQ